MEMLFPQFVKVLVNILIWQITTDKHTMRQPIWPGKLPERFFRHSLLNELIEPFEVEAGRGSTNKALARKLHGQGKGIWCSDFLDYIQSSSPWEEDRCQQRKSPWARNPISRCGTNPARRQICTIGNTQEGRESGITTGTLRSIRSATTFRFLRRRVKP
jgi:hypothetical protein